MKNNTKKQDIIKAFAFAIEKQGLEGASLGAVARQMGINQSLIFHYFENKEDLICRLTEHVCHLCEKSYEKALAQAEEYTPDTLAAFVEYVLEIHHKRRRSVSPKLYFALTYLLPRQPQVRESFAHLAETAVGLIAAKLSQFAEAGVISSSDLQMSARTLLCLADGILCYDELTPAGVRERFVAAQRDLYLASIRSEK